MTKSEYIKVKRPKEEIEPIQYTLVNERIYINLKLKNEILEKANLELNKKIIELQKNINKYARLLFQIVENQNKRPEYVYKGDKE